ncbi:MAG: YfhO family protein, partial [Clostridia bacterium]|nr:YfhO family protein [Clostridia bacterium]
MFENISHLGDITYYDDGSEDKTLLLTDEALSFDCEKLALTSALSFETDNRGFTATVDRNKDSLVFFSVPFDEGWTATVNGEKVDIEKVNVGFMAVKVSKGLSEIRFTYTTPGLLNGLIITTISAAVLLLYVIIFTVWSKKRVVYNNYPEGDTLIKDWKNQELLEDAETEIEPEEVQTNETEDLKIPNLETGFEGGFKINTDIE